MLTDQMTKADAHGILVAEKLPEIRPAAIFSDGVVLQRHCPIPLWGYAPPRSRVECSLGESRAVTFSGGDGAFFLKLPPQKAAQNLELFFTCGDLCCRIKNVAVGEVFLIAGQSNVEYDLTNVREDLGPVDDLVRSFRVKPMVFPGKAGDVSGAWQTAAQSRGYSAIGYFFASSIRRELDVPVGIVNVSRGGVGAETFISEYRLACDPFYGKLLNEYEAARFLPENNPETSGDAIVNSSRLMRRIRDCNPGLPPLKKELENWFSSTYDDGSWQTQELPGSWSLAGHQHTGVFLYRKKISLPAHWQGKKLQLSLGICDRADVCFVNGEKIGSTGKPNGLSFWNTVRRYEIAEHLTQSETLVIAVQATAFCSICTFGGLVGPREEMFLACGEEKISLAGVWQLAEAADTGCAVMENMIQTGAGEAKSFHMLYDNCLAPLENLALNSVLWYQGEANTLSFPGEYAGLLRGVIRTFRDLFKNPRLPVTVFMLPGFQEERLYSRYSSWAMIREAQLQVTWEETGEPPVNLCDCGDKDDIHPPEKRIPGERAAAVVLARMRGGKVPVSAVFKGAFREGKRMILSFETGDAVLAEIPEYCGLAGVGADGRSVPLKAELYSPTQISVTLPEEEIRLLAYGWCENPAGCRIKSTNQLPAFPFTYPIE